MKGRYFFGVVLSILAMAGSQIVLAQNAPGNAKEMVAVSGSVDAGNKICPVLGEKIDEKTKATYEYKGKIYNFCCAMCIDEFKKDPDKYIKKVEEEVPSASREKSGQKK